MRYLARQSSYTATLHYHQGTTTFTHSRFVNYQCKNYDIQFFIFSLFVCYLPLMFPRFCLGVPHAILGHSTIFGRFLFVPLLFPTCSLVVPSASLWCSMGVHLMFQGPSLFVPWPFFACSFSVHLAFVWRSLSVHWPFNELSLGIPWTFYGCSLAIPWPFLALWALSVPWVLFGQFFGGLWGVSLLSALLTFLAFFCHEI